MSVDRRPLKQNFCMVPIDAITDPKLTSTDIRVLVALVGYAGKEYYCDPTDKMLAYDLSCAESTIQASIKSLEKRRWIRRDKEENTGKRRVIWLNWLRIGDQNSGAETPESRGIGPRGMGGGSKIGGLAPNFGGLRPQDSGGSYSRNENRTENSFSRPPTNPDPIDPEWGEDGYKPVEEWRDCTLQWQLEGIEHDMIEFELMDGNPIIEWRARQRARILAELSRRGLL